MNHPDGDDDMKVSELIETLEEQDSDAEVLVMSQPNWPFELSLAGVTTREEMLRAMQRGTAAPASAALSMRRTFGVAHVVAWSTADVRRARTPT